MSAEKGGEYQPLTFLLSILFALLLCVLCSMVCLADLYEANLLT